MNQSYVIGEKYSGELLDVIQTLEGWITGTGGDPIYYEYLVRYRWLKWRVCEDAWHQDKDIGKQEYSSLIRALAINVLDRGEDFYNRAVEIESEDCDKDSNVYMCQEPSKKDIAILKEAGVEPVKGERFVGGWAAPASEWLKVLKERDTLREQVEKLNSKIAEARRRLDD